MMSFAAWGRGYANEGKSSEREDEGGGHSHHHHLHHSRQRPVRCVCAAGAADRQTDCGRTDRQTEAPVQRLKPSPSLCSAGTWRQNVQNATRRCTSVSARSACVCVCVCVSE